MYRGRTISLSLPPFTGWVRRIILACVGVYLLQLILDRFDVGRYVIPYFGLVPALVVHGWVWQLITYGFLHASVGHIFFNMLTLWFIGSYLERDWGQQRFIECYLFCLIGAALVTVGIAHTGILGMRPDVPTVGASGAIFGLLMAFGMLYGEQEMFMFPLPFMIKAKYLVGIWIVIAIFAIFDRSSGVASFAHLGGLLFGFIFVKFLPRRGVSYAASEKYFSWRNSFYRWKRKRAARKFEVYMRQHDRKVMFDEHGNYIPPDDDSKPNGGSKSGWVN